MRYDPKENTAGKRQFDIVLPPDVRAEILEPKWPAILRRPIRERSSVLKFAGTFALAAIVLAAAIGHYSQSLKVPVTSQPDPVLEHSREILEHPAPVPPPQPVSQPPVEQNRPIQQPTSQPPRLVWEWVRSEAYGPVWVQCYETCTPARGGLILRDPAPHAQLVQMEPILDIRLKSRKLCSVKPPITQFG